MTNAIGALICACGSYLRRFELDGVRQVTDGIARWERGERNPMTANPTPSCGSPVRTAGVSRWKRHGTVKPAHEPVRNEPWAIHATLVTDVPFLCIFDWTQDINTPAKTVFAGDWPMLKAAL